MPLIILYHTTNMFGGENGDFFFPEPQSDITDIFLPAAASTAVRRSLLSFFSWVRWFLISCFFFISTSSLDWSRLASASTRFFPYLHWSPSAPRILIRWGKIILVYHQDSAETWNAQKPNKLTATVIQSNFFSSDDVIWRNALGAGQPKLQHQNQWSHPLSSHLLQRPHPLLLEAERITGGWWLTQHTYCIRHWKYEKCVAYSKSNMTHIWIFHSDIWSRVKLHKRF